MITAASPSPIALPTANAGGGDAPASRRATIFDAKAQAAADQKLSELRDAVAKLKTVGKSASSAGADIARKKLDALKQRLKMLMMMGGDPKTVAKEAAQIAKEIGKAAKDYADASGGSDNGAAASAASDAATAQQAADTAGAQDQAADQPDATADQAADGQAVASSADSAKTDAPAKSDDSAKTDDADPAKADAAATDPKPAEARTKIPAPAASIVQPTTTHAAGKTKLPDPVIEEARALEASAQAIAKAALQRLKAEHRFNPDAKKEQDELEQGEKDFKAAAKEIYGDTGEPSGSGDASSPYAADGSATPAPAPDTGLVSVKA